MNIIRNGKGKDIDIRGPSFLQFHPMSPIPRPSGSSCFLRREPIKHHHSYLASRFPSVSVLSLPNPLRPQPTFPSTISRRMKSLSCWEPTWVLYIVIPSRRHKTKWSLERKADKICSYSEKTESIWIIEPTLFFATKRQTQKKKKRNLFPGIRMKKLVSSVWMKPIHLPLPCHKI